MGRGDVSDPIGLLSIRQPPTGYRFSIDSVLLAGFAARFCRGGVLDLGTGCGVLLLLLSRLSVGMTLGVGVELQEELFECACDNFSNNALESDLKAFHGDFREMPPDIIPGSFSLVVSNPPYVRAGHGRPNPDMGKEAARSEIHSTLEDLFSAASRFMSPTGRFALILPFDRFRDIEACCRRERMSIKVVRLVCPREGTPPSRILCCLSKEKCGATEELAPLIIHGDKDKYSPEVESICRLFRSGVQLY